MEATYCLAVGLILLSSSLRSIHAHVVLVYPIPRTDNDYLFTFDDGVCVGNTCNSFCGDPFNVTVNPLTMLPVETPVTIRWNVTFSHPPLHYRLALGVSGENAAFDENSLTVVTNEEARDDSTSTSTTGIYATTVTFPSTAVSLCNDEHNPCVLQLYDLYYFVSCANVRFAAKDSSDNGSGDNDNISDDDGGAHMFHFLSMK